MKLILFSALFAIALSFTSCKSGDKCSDCPKFSNIENGGTTKQV